ncbi:MAG: glycosyltransferase [Bacilli bacterium]|nr:glycosyltransferase [Bacilli bacterium]
MKKYIHYCWFGDKPFPKMGEKCLKSWKKYLPDFEIIKWSEENIDLEECPFIKGAYENKKWAFMADYARAKALKEYGGIYFDTDMEVTKDISHLFEHATFLGIEDSGAVAVGAWYESEPNSILSTKLLEKYRSFASFEPDKLSELAVPKLLSAILEEYGVVYGSSKIQVLEHDICIYPREYFYPYSYNRDNNIFTDNTCMVHYYDASWVPFKERMEMQMVRKLGKRNTIKALVLYRKTKHYVRQTGKVVLFPLVLYKRQKRKNARIDEAYLNNKQTTIDLIQSVTQNQKDYIVFYNKDWMGVSNATKELFENLVTCTELFRKQDVKQVGNAIIESGVSQVIFSSFAEGWKSLVLYLHKQNPELVIKTFWHGNHSQILDIYGWRRNQEMIDLHRKGIIKVFGTCKQSIMDFYKEQGIKACFITNKVDTKIKKAETKKGPTTVGLYAATCYDWRKNTFAQIAAISLLDNVVLDLVPLNSEVKDFAESLNITLTGLDKPLPREELMKRMAQNDVNLYVTFSECAPMLPLESLEVGVPCITGNNHHYFKGKEIESYLVVDNEESPVAIKDKIQKCLKNKDKIIELYQKEIKKQNKKESQKNVKQFLEM